MVTAPTDVPFKDIPLLERDISWEHRADGTILVRHNRPLTDVPEHVPALLRRNAALVPERTWLAERRGPEGAWQELTYGAAAAAVDAVTQALLDLGVDGPVMVLSGNSLEHAQLQIAAMQARLPVVPVTAAYSLAVSEFSRLRSMVDLIEPAVIFVQDADAFGRALDAVAGDRWVIAVDGTRAGDRVLRWADLAATTVTPDVEASIAAITPDTVAKYLFTSGSTGTPKAVTVTQRMLGTLIASNHTLIATEKLTDHPQYIEWLPWSHVAGGNAVFCKVLMSGATLYLDGGRPTPDAFGETLRNLREISPTSFSSMPVGYAMMVDAFDDDPDLAATFFKNLISVTYSGARLPDDIYHRFQRHAIAHTGRRVPFLSGFGSTETSPACAFVYWPAERPGLIGLPQPGVELKLVPLDEGRYDVRVRSDSVTPGYYKQPELTAAAFDEEGFYRMGDAASFADPERPDEGLVFAGRVAEEFKLTTGVFVRVTSLRVAALTAAAPYLQEVVVAGADEPYVALLAWPNDHARAELGAGPDTDLRTFEPLRDRLRAAFATYNADHPASSMRIRRILLMDEPFSQEHGEINDKRYVNQRRVLDRRRDAVQALYADEPGPFVLELE